MCVFVWWSGVSLNGVHDMAAGRARNKVEWPVEKIARNENGKAEQKRSARAGRVVSGIGTEDDRGWLFDHARGGVGSDEVGRWCAIMSLDDECGDLKLGESGRGAASVTTIEGIRWSRGKRRTSDGNGYFKCSCVM